MSDRIVVQNQQAPGDLVVLSAALRDIRRQYPGQHQFFLDCSQPDVFRGNLGLSFGAAPNARYVPAKYNDRRTRFHIHNSNTSGAHFLWGMLCGLNRELGTQARLLDFWPDLHLSQEERAVPLVKLDKPYWVVLSGGKKDYPAKVWSYTHWQTLVDKLVPEVVVVQAGASRDLHPPLRGALDLVKKTSFREFMRLIYHAQGVVCAVTAAMHIAAAFHKPCVVIAGGREHWTWEAYTDENRLRNMRFGDPGWTPPANDPFVPHQYLHTIGELDCCREGGCWRAHVGPGASKRPCTRPVQHHGQWLPECQRMIGPERVYQAVKWYFGEGYASRPKTVVQVPLRAPESPPEAAPETPPEPKAQPEPVTVADFYPLVFVAMTPGYPSAKAYLRRVAQAVPSNRGQVLVATAQPDPYAEGAAIELGLPYRAFGVDGRAELLEAYYRQDQYGWGIWLEPPWLPGDAQWLDHLSRLLDPQALHGRICWSPVRAELQALHPESPVDPLPHDPRRGRWWHPGRGVLVAPQAALKELLWPPAQPVADADVELLIGALSRRNGRPLKDIGHTLEVL